MNILPLIAALTIACAGSIYSHGAYAQLGIDRGICIKEWNEYSQIATAVYGENTADQIVFSDINLNYSTCHGAEVNKDDMMFLAAMAKSIYDLKASRPEDEYLTETICVASTSRVHDREYISVLLPNNSSELNRLECKNKFKRSLISIKDKK